VKPVSRWAHMMASTCTVAVRTGTNSFGQPTYGTAVTYKCHISRKKRMISNAAGEQIDAGQTIYLNTNAMFEPTAQVTLTTGDVGSTQSHAINPRIVSVERLFDQTGPHHTVLYME
jgi:hypothetical protein